MNMINYGLREKYEDFAVFGDKLAEMEKLVDWEAFRHMLSDLYRNDMDIGGRPNNDPVLMVKILFLQSIYSLVDEAMEKEANNRIDFMNFLGYPDKVPDSRTIWLFRERREEVKIIQREFESRGITTKKEVVRVNGECLLVITQILRTSYLSLILTGTERTYPM